MNLFEAVKDAVPARTAAEYYGIEAGRNGMACCPFHDDKNPSMKLDSRYHCFGCGEDGDAIDFVGKLYGLTPKEAAEKIALDFGIRYDGLKMWDTRRRPSVISKLTAVQEYRKKENRCCRVLSEYDLLLANWKERYAPKQADEDWHPMFVEALQRMDYIEYLLDGLTCGPPEERAAIVKGMEKELDVLEKRIADYFGREVISREPVRQTGSARMKVRRTCGPEELAM